MNNIAIPRTQLYLAGEYVDASDGTTTDITSPVTGEVIASVAVPTTADLNKAVAAAREAQQK